MAPDLIGQCTDEVKASTVVQEKKKAKETTSFCEKNKIKIFIFLQQPFCDPSDLVCEKCSLVN